MMDRSAVIDRLSLRTATGGLKTLGEIEYEGNKAFDEEELNVRNLRRKQKGGSST
jgi:hypothetical protein